jgi:hypothetical protein
METRSPFLYSFRRFKGSFFSLVSSKYERLFFSSLVRIRKEEEEKKSPSLRYLPILTSFAQVNTRGGGGILVGFPAVIFAKMPHQETKRNEKNK